MMNSGVYAIRNVANGKTYVGSSIDLAKRGRTHFAVLRKNRHDSRHLQNAFNRYGEKSFKFEVLEEWEPEFLISMEQWWINMLRPAYNTCAVAGNCLGRKHTDAAKRRMSEAVIRNYTEDRRHRVAEANSRRVFSEETLRKMSEVQKGKTASEETRRKQSAAHIGRGLGRQCSEETRRKQSAAHRGRSASKETRRKMSEVKMGVPRSEETKTKMRIAMMGNKKALGHHHTAETRRKQSAANKGQVPWSKGKAPSEDTRRKLREALEGRVFSEEHRRKLREAWIIRRAREAKCETS